MTSISLHPVPTAVTALGLNELRSGDSLERVASAPVPVSSPIEIPSDEAVMRRALKLGAIIGIPLVFLVTGAIGYLGGAGLGPAALIGLYCGFWGNGIYLGGIFFLPRGQESSPTPPRRLAASSLPDTAIPDATSHEVANQ